MHKLLVDCDAGIDDTIALLYAALLDDVELVGVTSVWGNVDVGLATRNALHTLAMVGLDAVPVARGAAGPLNGDPAGFAYHVHGADGQGNAGPAAVAGAPVPGSAAELIVRTVRAHPGEVDLVAVGPLTNLALALGLDPELPALVRHVSVMGGAALAPGNVTPAAEANVWHDPEAAHAVFAAPWNLTMVPLDVTMRVLLTEDDRARLAASQAGIARYVAGITDFYFDYFAAQSYDRRCSPMHDVLAVAVATDRLVPRVAPVVDVTVDTGAGPSRGATVCDLRGAYRGYPAQPGAHCRVLLEADPAFAQEVVRALLGAGDSRV